MHGVGFRVLIDLQLNIRQIFAKTTNLGSLIIELSGSLFQGE